MPNERFEQLMRDFCATVQIDDVLSVLETGSVTVNDIAFSIFPSDDEVADSQSDAALVYCDFGPLPAHNAMAVVRRLLEVNLFLTSAPLACSFAINPESEHVILAFRSPLGATTPEALASSLQLCAEEAVRWRETYFLDGDPEPLRSAPMRGGSMMV
jgi:hypothetical protein